MYLHEPCQSSKKLLAKIGNTLEKGLPNTENRLPKRILAVDFLDKGLREGDFYIIVRLKLESNNNVHQLV